VYTLVSAPVLGFDLARMEGGAATAELLLAALALSPEDLPVLAAPLPTQSVRAELWLEVAAAAMLQRRTADLFGLDAERAATLLLSSPIGSLDGLLHCLRHDVLDWLPVPREAEPVEPRAEHHAAAGAAEPGIEPPDFEHDPAGDAVAVLCDVAAACYLRAELTPLARRRLSAGWVVASRRLPTRPADLGPQHRAVAKLLDRVRLLSPSRAARLLSSAENARQQRADWAAAMHSASWAVYLSGRVRAAAAAQLALVSAVDAAGVPVADRAAGVWNALSGVVHALMVRDVTDQETTHRLLNPYLTALGPSGLD
jgi:hypothetical protein